MNTFTFIITDWFEVIAPLTLTVEAFDLRTAVRKAHVAATCKGFDNDCLSINEATPEGVGASNEAP